MRTLFFSIILAVFPALHAQFYDDFSTCSLSDSIRWQGMRNAFVCSNGRLQSAYSLPNSVFYLSRQVKPTYTEFQWSFDVQLGFNTSSLNYVDFVLFADSANLLRMQNACFLRIGGSSDELSLFRLQNGTETKIVDGKDGLLNAASSRFEIKLIYAKDSLYLYYRIDSSYAFDTGGVLSFQFQDSLNGYCGFKIRQSTSSFFGKHFFDRLYTGPFLKDSLAPVCDSVRIRNPRHIEVYFNEACDSSLLNPQNYISVLPLQIQEILPAPDKKRVLLVLESELPANVFFEFMLTGISDFSGNLISQRRFRLVFYKADTPAYRDILITEIMADPEPSAGLPEKEYIEISNVSGRFLQLGGCSISDPLLSIVLPSIVLHPDTVLVLYKVPVLNNVSDHLVLRNQKSELLHEVFYSDEMYRSEIKKNGGYSLEMIDLKEYCRNAENWSGSTAALGGTPGFQNAVQAELPKDRQCPDLLSVRAEKDSVLHLYFNEDTYPLPDMQVQVNGWHTVSADMSVDTLLNSCSFSLPFKPAPDTLYSLRFTGFYDCPGNVCKDLVVKVQWPQEAKPGMLCFSEVLFNPKSGGRDFIELYNEGPFAFNLSDVFVAETDAYGNPLRIFQMSKSYCLLYPGQYLLLSEDSSSICSTYACGSQGVKLQMQDMPSMPDEGGQLSIINLSGETIERCIYRGDMHFPLLSDRNGVSLERIRYNVPSLESSNWHSAASTAGYATPLARNSQFSHGIEAETSFEPVSGTFSPDSDGFEDLMLINYRLPEAGYSGLVRVFTGSGLPVKTLCNNCSFSGEGMLSWNGYSEQGILMPPGIYVLIAECSKQGNSVIREKFAFVLAARF